MSRLAAVLLASLVAVPAVASAQAKPKLNDATILAIFDAANTADIESAGVGAWKASDPAIRTMAQNFARDHFKVRHMGRELAARLHLTPTPPAGDQSAAKQDALMKELGDLQGKAFDKAFLDHEIAFHQAVLDAVSSTLLPAIQNDSLAAFVKSVAPAFQGHLAGAKALRAKMGN
jgi:putative membrane protein